MNAEESIPPPEEPVPAMATDGHTTGIVDESSSPQQLSAEQAESNTSTASRAMDEVDSQAMNEEGDVFIFRPDPSVAVATYSDTSDMSNSEPDTNR